MYPNSDANILQLKNKIDSTSFKERQKPTVKSSHLRILLDNVDTRLVISIIKELYLV